MRKQLRSERKTPKQLLKQVHDWLIRKQRYEKILRFLTHATAIQNGQRCDVYANERRLHAEWTTKTRL